MANRALRITKALTTDSAVKTDTSAPCNFICRSRRYLTVIKALDTTGYPCQRPRLFSPNSQRSTLTKFVVSKLTMSTPDLPIELWLEILRYHPRSTLRKMMGVNRVLFELALDDLYSEVQLITDDEDAKRTFAQLRCVPQLPVVRQSW